MIRRFYDFPDGRMSAVHFGPIAEAPKVLFAHANGFNGLSYKSILEPLGVHSIALDLRGHGMSELPTDVDALKSWNTFRDDIAYFAEKYLEAPIVLAGHSFGAVSAALAAPKMKDKISGYVGFDPVSLPWAARQFSYLPGSRAYMKKRFPIARNAGRRRNIFESFDEAFERYQNRGAFKGMSDAALRDYLSGGLKNHTDGVELACHPLWEQAIFVAQRQNLFAALPALPENTQIIYGGKASVSTKSTRKLAAKKLGGGQVAFHPDFHHLFPFHQPEFSTAAISRALDQAI